MSFKIALLIDAENISYKDLPRIIEVVGRHDRIVLRAVYGDWYKEDLYKWYEVAKANNFNIRHQTSASKTKNSSDMKLIMDAMEVLYRTSVEVFCIVTNDADYVPLCDKVHEAKKQVIGVGYQHAAEAFIRSCDQFIFIGQGQSPTPAPTKPTIKVPNNTPKQAPKPKIVNQPDIQKILALAFARAPQEADRWITLSALGTALSQVKPGFKTNHYGHATLSKLLQAMPDFVEFRSKDNIKTARLKNHIPATPTETLDLPKLVETALVITPQEADGWIELSTLGSTLRQIQPGFQSSNYGHATLSKLLQTMPDVVEIQTNGTIKSARLKK